MMMAIDPNQPPARVAFGDQTETPGEPPSYARLAKRISAVTTKCLLTAVVLVAGLGFGRQVLRWWAADAVEPAVGLEPTQVADGLGDPRRAHLLQFGDLAWSLRRQIVFGDRHAAGAALRASCREIVQQSCLPDDRAGEAERELLARTAAYDPIEQEPGRWRLYQLPGELPAIVGTQAAVGSDPTSGKSLAVASPRVVTWGVATPTERAAWTVYTFQPVLRSEPSDRETSAVPIPPGSKRLLSVSVDGGGAVTAFEGGSDAKAWMDFFDRWFKMDRRGKLGGWRNVGSNWHGRYSMSTGAEGRVVDVHFSARDRLSGLLVLTPSPREEGRGESE